MKRLHIMVIAAVVFAALAFPGAAFANSMRGSSDMKVTFDSSGKMNDEFSSAKDWKDEIKSWDDEIGKLQPGDDITFTVKLIHEYDTACDWYMHNGVIKSLEESHAAGSAYSYKLTYTNPSGTSRVLYDSTEVGGDDTKGLLDATSALEDYFYLDNLKKGQQKPGIIQLNVGLDGETEGNAYFDTKAQLKLQFAVELPTKGSSSNTTNTTTRGSDRSTVQTGDETNLFPFYMAMVISGAALLALGIFSARSRKREREQE